LKKLELTQPLSEMNLIKRAWTSECYIKIYDDAFQMAAAEKRNASRTPATLPPSPPPQQHQQLLQPPTNDNTGLWYEDIVENEIVNNYVDTFPTETNRTPVEVANELLQEQGMITSILIWQ
jgi:hypothetical protein